MWWTHLCSIHRHIGPSTTSNDLPINLNLKCHLYYNQMHLIVYKQQAPYHCPMHLQHACFHLSISAICKLGNIILVMSFMLSHWPLFCQRGTTTHSWNTMCMSMVRTCFTIHHLLTQSNLERPQILCNVIFHFPHAPLLLSCGPHNLPCYFVNNPLMLI